jgi:hypothetical protein
VKTLIPCLVLLVLGVPAGADDTKAALKETLTVKDVQGGFAGFTGKQWTVEPSGKWKVYEVFNERLTEKAGGELKKEQLTELARELEKYRLADLSSKGKETTNPHVITISQGKKSVRLTLPPGDSLPKPDAGSVEGRFSGVASAVQKLLREK